MKLNITYPKITKGEWTLSRTNVQDFREEIIAECSGMIEDDANALLISRAPAMAEYLVKQLEYEVLTFNTSYNFEKAAASMKIEALKLLLESCGFKIDII